MPALISISAAAELVSVSPTTIRRRIHDGSLPAVKVAGRWRLDPNRLNHFRDHRTLHASGDTGKSLEVWAQRLVEDAPPLTDGQRTAIAILLGVTE